MGKIIEDEFYRKTWFEDRSLDHQDELEEEEMVGSICRLSFCPSHEFLYAMALALFCARTCLFLLDL